MGTYLGSLLILYCKLGLQMVSTCYLKTNKICVKAYRSASTFSKAPTLFLPIMSVVGTEIRSIDFGYLLSVRLEHFSRIFLLSIMLVTSAVLSRNSAQPVFQPCQPRRFPHRQASALPKKQIDCDDEMQPSSLRHQRRELSL